MKGLTERQRDILDYIDQFITKNGFSPSYREIQDAFQLASTGSVHKHIKALARKEAITLEPHCSRSIALPQKTNDEKEAPEQISTAVPLTFMGNFTPGYPLEMHSESSSMEVPVSMVRDPQRSYLLRVRSELLYEMQISCGDLLIVEAKSYAEAGDTVLVQFDSPAVHIRKYFPEGPLIRLEEVSTHEETLLHEEEFKLLCSVIGLLRAY